MAISEATKREVQSIVGNLKQQADALEVTKQEYQSLIVAIDSRLVDLKARRDSLVKDIPKPTVVDMGV